MKARLALSVVLLAAAHAAAQDGAKPGNPADPAKPSAPAPAAPAPSAPAPSAPAAKKERKTSPEAEAAVKKYAALLLFPNSTYKTLEFGSNCDVPMLGGEVGCKFVCKQGGDVAIDVTVPEAARQQFGEEQLKVVKRMVAGIFKPFLVPADVVAQQYDMASRVEKDKTVVEMTRFADDAAWDKLTLWFGAEGLLEKQSGTPNLDPNDPMAMMNAGAEIETTMAYKKRGDRYTIESAKIAEPTGESTVALAYFEIPDVAPLPRQIVFTSPLIGEIAIAVHDYVIDGKKVAGTERKDEKKPAPPSPKPSAPAKPPEPTSPTAPPKSGTDPKAPGDAPK